MGIPDQARLARRSIAMSLLPGRDENLEFVQEPTPGRARLVGGLINIGDFANAAATAHAVGARRFRRAGRWRPVSRLVDRSCPLTSCPKPDPMLLRILHDATAADGTPTHAPPGPTTQNQTSYQFDDIGRADLAVDDGR